MIDFLLQINCDVDYIRWPIDQTQIVTLLIDKLAQFAIYRLCPHGGIHLSPNKIASKE